MKVGLMQRVLAGYRVPFFDMLAERLDGTLSLYAGAPRESEMIDSSKEPQVASLWRAKNRNLFSGKAFLCFQTDVRDWLRTEDPDVLIMEANLRYPMSALAARWMRQKNRPVIGWGLGTGNTASGFLNQKHLSRYDALITYSHAGLESYAAAGFPKDRIFLARNAAVPKPTRQMPERPASFTGVPKVLYVGRIQERKRLDLLMRACAELESFRPALRIVGDGPIRPQLEALAASLYPETVFSGSLYGDELTAAFDDADLFVLPGTGGLAIQQAMASALPVIAAEADGTQTDLVRPENGLIVKPGDLESLKQAMTALLSDPMHLREMGAESFRIVRDEINLEAMADAFIGAINRVRSRS